MGGLIRQEDLDAARLAGACESVDLYRVGQPVSDLDQGDLIWFEDKCPSQAETLRRGGPPLWALADAGSGTGSGYGDGYGYGSGYGYGYSD